MKSIKRVSMPIPPTPLNLRNILLAAYWGLVLYAIVLRVLFNLQLAEIPILSVSFSAPIHGEIDLYYDTGNGFSAYDSTRIHSEDIVRKNWLIELFAKPAVNTSSFQVPRKDIERVQIQADTSQKSINIKGLALVNGLGLGGKNIGCTSHDPQLPAGLGETIECVDTLRTNESLGVSFLLIALCAVECLLALFVAVLPSFLISRLHLKESRLIRTLHTKQNEILNVLAVVILFLLSAVHFYFYWRLNERIFPLFWGKFMVVAALAVAIFFLVIDQRYKKLKVLFTIIAIYYLILFLSAAIHKSAVLDVPSPDVISYNQYQPSTLPSSGVVFDNYLNFKEIVANQGSKQTKALYFFPLMLVALTAIFSVIKNKPNALVGIPLLIVPNIIVALIQQAHSPEILIGGPGVSIGLFFEIQTLRLMLFMVVPLTVLGLILLKSKWQKGVYFCLFALELWLLYLTNGRAVIGGTVLFLGTVYGVHAWAKNKLHRIRNVYLVPGLLILVVLVVAGTACRFGERPLPGLGESFCTLVERSIAEYRDDPRAEMDRQAWRIFLESPIAGFGPGAFQKNAPRLRYLHGEPDGFRHEHTNLYFFFLTNYGLVGFCILLVLLLSPLALIFRGRKRLTSYEDRISVGLVSSGVVVCYIVFSMVTSLSIPEVGFMLSVYLGFLLATSLANDNSPSLTFKRYHFACLVVICAIFGYWSYQHSFGEYGYRKIQEQVVAKVYKDKSIDTTSPLWDISSQATDFSTATELIHTKTTPFQPAYSTLVFSVKALSKEQLFPYTDFLAVKVLVPEQRILGNFFCYFDVLINGIRQGEQFAFYEGGEKILVCDMRNSKLEKIAVQIRADYWKALPFHLDRRKGIDNIPYETHPDFEDTKVVVKIESMRSPIVSP